MKFYEDNKGTRALTTTLAILTAVAVIVLVVVEYGL